MANIKKKSFFNVALGGVNLTQVALFAKNLSVMLKAGMSISDSLSIAIDSTTGKLQIILQSIHDSVESGTTLSKALKEYPKVFSNLFINSVYSGEISGQLAENLEYIAESLEKERELRSKIKSAMTYPILVLSVAFVLGLGLSFFILPKLVPLFTSLRVELPFTTRAILWFGEFIQQYGIFVVIGAVAIVSFLIFLFRSNFMKPFIHWTALKIPGISKISHSSNNARFCSSLASLLHSGLNIDEAVEATSRSVDNYYYQKALATISDSVRKGSKLSDNLEQYPHLFPIVVTRMIRVGEQSGGMETSLNHLARFYEVEVDSSLKSFTSIIEPILLLFIGAIVAFVGLSIISPMYDITSGIHG